MKFKRFSNPFHPGEILLEEFLEPLGFSQRKFTKKLGWTPRKLNEIIKGNTSVIPADKFIDIPARHIRKNNVDEFWADLNVKMGKKP